ncbi:unnamed protein product, partial [Ixodes persulcatus]
PRKFQTIKAPDVAAQSPNRNYTDEQEEDELLKLCFSQIGKKLMCRDSEGKIEFHQEGGLLHRSYTEKIGHVKSFDTVLGSTGVLIQNAFGLLITLELLTVHRMSRFIAACCVLHNLRIDAGDTEVRDTQVEELMLRPDSRGSPEEDLSLSDATARVLRRIKWDKLIFNEKRAM